MTRFDDGRVELHHGDCLDVLAGLDDCSVDAIITDPPYGLAEHTPATIAQAITAWTTGDRSHVPDGKGFMGRAWDAFVPPPAVWDECLRVLRPGGHLLAFAGSRTVDLMGLSIRLAGFEMRDSVMWLHGQGFPKGIDVSKAIDKAAGAEREVIGTIRNNQPGGTSAFAQGGIGAYQRGDTREREIRGGAVLPEAKRWQGWGTALKPAHEPIIVARKPLSGTVAQNVLTHGTGALNIDATRVAGEVPRTVQGQSQNAGQLYGADQRDKRVFEPHTSGRWPTNVVLTHSPACRPPECEESCPVAELDRQSEGTRAAKGSKGSTRGGGGHIYGGGSGYAGTVAEVGQALTGFEDGGSAARFFPVFRYQAKAPSKERPKIDGKGWPTVKPLDLMRWLVRLVTPPTIAYAHCVSCGYDSDPLRRVREDVSAKAEGADPVLDRMPAAPRGSSQEAPARPVPDVREGADGEDAEVLLDSMPRGGEPQADAGVPGVRDGVPSDRRPASDVLEGVRSRADATAAAGLRPVRDAVSADSEHESVLQPDMCVEGTREAEAAPRAPSGDGSGIRRAVPAGAPDGGSAWNGAGAPEGHGGPPRSPADARRGRAPRQRDQDGQPDREPATPPEGGARPDPEAAAAADHLPPLQRPDQGLGPCPSCGADLRRDERPGVILDPFAGTGTTLQAARAEGMRAIGVERDDFAYRLACQRLGGAPERPRRPDRLKTLKVGEVTQLPSQGDLLDLLGGEAS